jgi:hypothetical protein
MGVYLCVGQSIHTMNLSNAKPFSYYGSFIKIQNDLIENDSIFVFLGSGLHKIKKKAEQIACDIAIKLINT